MNKSVIEKDDGYTRITELRGNDDSGFWAICSGEFVAACSKEASDRGVIPGSTHGSDLIAKKDRAVFDSMMRGNTTVSSGQTSTDDILIEAAPGTGYAVAHCAVSKLFSRRVVRIQMYKDKKEFISSPEAAREKFERMCSFVGNTVRDAARSLSEAMDQDASADISGREFRSAVGRLCTLALDTELLETCAKMKPGAPTLFDAAELFRRISENAAAASLRYKVRFECMPDKAAICRTNADSFAGMILLSAAVCAGLSRKGECTVSLYSGISGTGDESDDESGIKPSDIVLEASCDPAIRPGFTGRCLDTGILYRSMLPYPAELMAYEYLAADCGAETETKILPDGRLVLRAAISAATDPDRLKHPDTPAATDAIRYYLNHIIMSSEAQKQCENQDNVSEILSSLGIRRNDEYYSAEQKLIGRDPI